MDREQRIFERREFLRLLGRAALAGTAASSLAIAQEGLTYSQPDDLDRYDFVLPRIQLTEVGYHGAGKGPDRWDVRPGGDANLLRELSTVIRCRVKPIQNAVNWEPEHGTIQQFNAVLTFDNLNRLREYPFLFVTSENGFRLTDTQKQNLQDYVVEGGFILMDDCVVGNGGDFFYRCAHEVLEEIFGRGSVHRIPNSHEIFHNVYDFGDTGLPYLHYGGTKYPHGWNQPHGQNHGARGVFMGDRLAIFLSSNDLHCGWCDSQGLEWGDDGYRKTIQMGINIILYALTH